MRGDCQALARRQRVEKLKLTGITVDGLGHRRLVS